MTIQRLRSTLREVYRLSGHSFSGIGLIVHEANAKLPVFPMRPRAKLPASASLEESLALISSFDSDLHDGFHLLSTEWKVTAIAQYFSPPIVSNARINWHRNFGGRYVAAQFGSTMSGIKACGIATTSLGIAIFENGNEVLFETL